MKNLKSFVFLISLVLFSSGICNSQSFQIKAGLNYSYLRNFDQYQSYNDGLMPKIGFHLGGCVEFPLTNHFSIAPGLLFSNIGEKQKYVGVLSEPFTKKIDITNLYYLDLPINGKLSFNISKSRFFVSAGPYVGFGLFGKYNQKLTPSTDLNTKSNIDWGNDPYNNEFRRLDYGINAAVGLNRKSYSLNIFYSYGIADIQAFDANKSRTKNRVLGISLGYSLNKK